MALTLTSKGLLSDATRAAKEVGLDVVAGTAGTVAGRALVRGARTPASRLALSAVCVGGGGVAMAVSGRHRWIASGGAGLVLGGLWGLVDTPSPTMWRW